MAPTAPLPGPRRAASRPASKRESKSTAAGAHTRFAPATSRATTASRTSAGFTLTTPPGFLANAAGSPLLPRGGDRRPRQPRAQRAARSARTRPARRPARSARRLPAPAPGRNPLYIPGKIYLAGPYKGAPLSLVVVVPAVAGPYDLGNVVVRAAVDVDPCDRADHGGLRSAAPDLRGHPAADAHDPGRSRSPGLRPQPDQLRHRSRWRGTVTGDEGAIANLSAPFQVANCTDLDYKPKLRLELNGGLKRRGHPAITRHPHRQSRVKRTPAEPSSPCPPASSSTTLTSRPSAPGPSSRPTSARPARSSARATAWSRRCSTRPSAARSTSAPRTAACPTSSPTSRGRSTSSWSAKIDTAKGGALRTTFEGLPDVPVEKFVLNLQGGKKGLLENSRSLCGKRKKAKVAMTGQNGWRLDDRVPLRTSCGSNAKPKRQGQG